MPFIAIALAIAAAVGGGASIAAQDSLPGDALYPVKINVNERIETALSFSQEAKAQAHLEAIEARQAEAKELQAEGRLSAEAKANLNANIEAHAEAFANALSHVRVNGDEQAIAQLEVKLKAALDAAAAVSANASSSVGVRGNSDAARTNAGNATSSDAKLKVETNSGVQVGL